jgi:cyclophilin family peptidyl-prolyl cis-trans isomerase
MRQRREVRTPSASRMFVALVLFSGMAVLPLILMQMEVFRPSRRAVRKSAQSVSGSVLDPETAFAGGFAGLPSGQALSPTLHNQKDAAGSVKLASSMNGVVGEHFVVQTKLGNITMKFRPDKAPRHVQFMKKLINSGKYNGMCWYRAEQNFVLQGGLRNAEGHVFHPGLPSPPLEYDLPNRRGFVNMARWEDLQSGGGDFCILLKDSPHLDRSGTTGYAAGFTVWAEVVEGMDVADRISRGPTKFVGGLNLLRDAVTFESVAIV